MAFPTPDLRPTVLAEQSPLCIWAVTTGEAGMQVQARGLAQALGGNVRELTIGLRAPWRHLRADLAPAPLMGLDPAGDRLAPPWPDVMITCGRRSAAASIGVRKASGGRTFTAHIGDPRAPAHAFDLVFPMVHDRLRGPNVLPVLTTFNAVALTDLARAARSWRERFAMLPRPLIGVAVGGSTRRRDFNAVDAHALIHAVEALRHSRAGGLALTVSRRTPTPARALLSAAFADRPDVLLWSGEGENPYQAILAFADELVVTSDSVSMISEVLATERPIHIWDLRCGGRHARFLDALVAEGLVGRLGREPPPPTRRRVDSTLFAARRVRDRLTAMRRMTAAEVERAQ